MFDIDGTLATASSVHLDALGAAAEALLGVPAVFEMRGERPYLNGTLVAGWVDSQCLRLLARQAGLDEDEMASSVHAVTQAYAATYRSLLADGAPAGVLVGGTVDALARLAEAGVPMGLSTGNAAAIAQAKLAALGIADYFTFDPVSGFGDSHADRSAVAAAAIRALPPARTVYLVGDTTADMRAATANAVHGVGGVHRRRDRPEPARSRSEHRAGRRARPPRPARLHPSRRRTLAACARAGADLRRRPLVRQPLTPAHHECVDPPPNLHWEQ